MPVAERIATFDQDGTLWVEHPIYSQMIYCLDRVPAVVARKPRLKAVEPFKTVPSGNHGAIAKLIMETSWGHSRGSTRQPWLGSCSPHATGATGRRSRGSCPCFFAAFLCLGVIFWPYMMAHSATLSSAAPWEASLGFLFYGASPFTGDFRDEVLKGYA